MLMLLVCSQKLYKVWGFSGVKRRRIAHVFKAGPEPYVCDSCIRLLYTLSRFRFYFVKLGPEK
jgi:hypothetical protein